MNKFAIILIVFAFISGGSLLFFRGDNTREEQPEQTSTATPSKLSTQPATTKYVSPPAGESTVLLTHQKITRTSFFYAPIAMSTQTLYPLVIVLHGGGGDVERIKSDTQFNQKADGEKFFVVYPTAVDGNWNDGRGSDPELALIDDVGFIKALIRELVRVKKYPIDQKRILVTGASNGGTLSYRLACEIPDSFALIAPVAANIPAAYFPLCKPPASVPFLTINGTADPLMLFNGGDSEIGPGGAVMSHSESIGVIAKGNGCANDFTVTVLPTIVDDGTSVTRRDYKGCDLTAPTIAYVIEGGGHAWPPAEPKSSFAGIASQNLIATDVIWEFFKQQSQ